MTGKKNKLLIIGWDGATFDVIRPMMARGEVPHLARLMAEGSHGPLRSTVPPSSALAWPTCMTGREPTGHGIFGFYQSDGHSYRTRLVSSRDVQAPYLWDWLGQAGYRVGVVNVPLTYPPRSVHGFLVTGMLTPGSEETFTYPPGLAAQLLAGPRPYPIEAQIMKQLRAASHSPSAGLELLYRWTDDFQVAVRYLLTSQPWDCFVVVYRTPDIVQHVLGFLWSPQLATRWAELAAQVRGGIEAVYRQMDACLGELLSLAPPETNVLIVSDHGAGPSFGCFYLNNWLHQHGYLTLKRGARYRRRLAVRRVPLRRGLTRLGLGVLARRLPLRLAEWPVPVPDKRRIDQMIDWRRTRAYVPFSGVQGAMIRLNLIGREPQGNVQPGVEAETLLAELARHLGVLHDPDGKPLFEQVTINADNWTSLVTNRGPDIIALPREENYHAVLPWLTDDGQILTGPRQRSAGQHRMYGIFVAHGPAIAAGVALQNARLVDITPTALHLMELPVPTEMDGLVLTEALQAEWRTAHPVQITGEKSDVQPLEQADVYLPEEAAKVEDALRALGYLD